MHTEFLSIKEAAERYSKAEITIRRLVRSIVQDKNNEDRGLINPTIDEVKDLKKTGKPYAYTISAELLEKKYAGDTTGEKAGKKDRSAGEYTALLEKTSERLLEQLRVKDEQIRALNQSLDELSERQRETNVLMKGLQERILLPASTAQNAKKRWWQRGG